MNSGDMEKQLVHYWRVSSAAAWAARTAGVVFMQGRSLDKLSDMSDEIDLLSENTAWPRLKAACLGVRDQHARFLELMTRVEVAAAAAAAAGLLLIDAAPDYLELARALVSA